LKEEKGKRKNDRVPTVSQTHCRGREIGKKGRRTLVFC
jgi:hypothetical protein